MLPDGRGLDLVRSCAPRLADTRWLLVASNEQGGLVREANALGVRVIDEAGLRELLGEASQ